MVSIVSLSAIRRSITANPERPLVNSRLDLPPLRTNFAGPFGCGIVETAELQGRSATIPTKPTIVKAVNSNSPDPDHAREELREGIETSRQLVRQSRLLIELSECDRAPGRSEDEYASAH
jgi:hypothetical protein